MAAVIAARLPDGVVALRRWRYAGIDCVVADVDGELIGLARLAGRVPYQAGQGMWWRERGPWVVLRTGPARRYWSVEILARFVSPSSPELAAWGDSGAEWAIERVHREVEEFVESVHGRS